MDLLEAAKAAIVDWVSTDVPELYGVWGFAASHETLGTVGPRSLHRQSTFHLRVR